ncbi:5'-methylthioadenosine nucleosidase @ S-adenosylhomocysteine nucleosidase [hydrothermal vent metagenome]|uniref:5'-methylthioadenosine nucleosidase @ S-adenosylhomocysteine nucleosidase n=1 Tax=hydrothermal vent metagenome TaxID=652676 RepID=A0A3B0U3U2_9ZZZZ
MNFEIKQAGGHDILYVMAVDAEYGPHLKKRFLPLFTGVGPVEAAISLTSALAALAANERSPHLVVSLGSAGSRTLVQTNVYQATSVSYRDIDASLLGFEKGTTPYLDLPAELKLPHQLPFVAKARLSSGAKVISGVDYDAIDAEMVDMESFALLRACQNFGLPMIALRGISDGKEELTGHNDWTQYLHIIDEKLAAVVDELETALTNNQLRL